MKCCGKERGDAYCSTCGKQLFKPNSIVGLLSYLRTQESQAEKKLRIQEARYAEYTDELSIHQEGRRETHLGKLRRTFEKWSLWANYVEAAIARSDDP